jgi:hypothetical protein
MTYEEFLAVDPDHTEHLSLELAALALDRAGRWDAAHGSIDDKETPTAQRVHAYLHRKEGDLSNARYWYGRVGEEMPDMSLDDEWSALVRRFLAEA